MKRFLCFGCATVVVCLIVFTLFVLGCFQPSVERVQFEGGTSAQELKEVKEPVLTGFIGDSITDEHWISWGGIPGWVQAWDELRGPTGTFKEVNFGGYKEFPDMWPDERGTGYETNRALDASRSTDALKKQLPPILESDVDLVFIAIGSNDFIRGDVAPLLGIATGWKDPTDRIDCLLANVRQMVEALSDKDKKVVLFALPDMGHTPVGKKFALTKGMQSRVASVVDRVNQGFQEIAQEHDVPLIDLSSVIRGEREVTISGITLATEELFSDDGLHPGKPLHAIILAAAIEAARKWYDFTGLSDKELLELCDENPEGDISSDDARKLVKELVKQPK